MAAKECSDLGDVHFLAVKSSILLFADLAILPPSLLFPWVSPHPFHASSQGSRFQQLGLPGICWLNGKTQTQIAVLFGACLMLW